METIARPKTKNKIMKLMLAPILTASLMFSSVGVANAAGPATERQEQPVAAAPGAQASAVPLIWGVAIKILTTKTACENALRVMPGNADLKCQKAGKVWVIVPKDFFG